MSDPCALTILKIPQTERASRMLCKSYAPGTEEGKPKRTEYDAGWQFLVARHTVPDIRAWAAFQRTMATIPFACLVRGEPVQGLHPQNARRLQINFPDAPRKWFLADFDKPDLPRGEPGALAARSLLPPVFHNAPCWWQRTGSYGIDFEGRKSTSDPWRSRIRLGFMLDTPLSGPQIKYWLRDYKRIVDLAIYTSNQINYTANPVFTDGLIDPVLACGEARFGTLDLDDAMLDEVPVPEEIATYVPTYTGVSVTSRPSTISAPKRDTLIEEARLCDEAEGGRHGTVARWVFDAYALGMDTEEILSIAEDTLVRLGREQEKAGPEVKRLIDGAARKMSDGNLTVSAHLDAASDFEPVPEGDPSATAVALTPAQAQVQNQQIIPWWDRLKITPSTGAFKPTIDNAAIIIHNHSSFQKDGCCILAFDAFRGVPVWTSAPPWWTARPSKSLPTIGELGHVLTDDDGVALAVWLGHLDPVSGNEGTPIHIGDSMAIKALAHVARYRTVNPVVEYLEKCEREWDGVARLDKVLTDICHASRASIVPSWFRKWMIQGVVRALKPGSKCDNVLVFQGGQGAHKSSFFRALCPFPELFFEGTLNFRDKDAMQEVQGKFIIELAEMSGTKKDVDVLKCYIAKQDDTYRASFGRLTERHPRTFIFAGSTNDEESLTDTSGRRWWMVSLPNKTIDLARTANERNLWWGEAVSAYRKGEQWWLDSGEDVRSREIATEHSVGMELSSEIAEWLDRPADKGGPTHADVVTPFDIWCGPMCKPKGAWHSGSGREVARLMSIVRGWTRGETRPTATNKIKLYVRDGSKFALDEHALRHYFKHRAAPSSAFTQPAA